MTTTRSVWTDLAAALSPAPEHVMGDNERWSISGIEGHGGEGCATHEH